MKFDGTVRGGAPIQSERLTIIHADIPTQIGWLDGIEAALRELRPIVQSTAVLDDASAIAQELRSEITSSQPCLDIADRLWRALLANVTFYPAC
jgi:hypothetical protein